MDRHLKKIVLINTACLMVIALIMMLMWFASGHFNLSDSSQQKLLIEITVFMLGSIVLFLRRMNLHRFDWLTVIMLLLIIAAFFYVYMEIRSVDFESGIPTLLIVFLFIIFCGNLYLLLSQFKKLLKD